VILKDLGYYKYKILQLCFRMTNNINILLLITNYIYVIIEKGGAFDVK